MNRLTSLCTTHLHSIEKTSFVMMNQQIQADNAESIHEKIVFETLRWYLSIHTQSEFGS